VLFLGKGKPWCLLAYQYLVGRKVDVGLVVTDAAELQHFVHSPVTDTLANALREKFDVGISYLYPKKIPKEILEHVPILNFHSAPLPDFRGVAGINFAILEGLQEWGVSVHWMAPELDAGPIVEVHRFKVDCNKETALSLDLKSQTLLFQSYIRTIDTLLSGVTPQGKTEVGGRYVSKRDFELARRIYPDDTPELAERKQRAFFFPPYEGAVPA